MEQVYLYKGRENPENNSTNKWNTPYEGKQQRFEEVSATSNGKHQGNISSPNNNSPITKLNGITFCDLVGNEFIITVLRKLKKLQDNRETQFNKIRETTHKRNFKITKR